MGDLKLVTGARSHATFINGGFAYSQRVEKEKEGTGLVWEEEERGNRITEGTVLKNSKLNLPTNKQKICPTLQALLH